MNKFSILLSSLLFFLLPAGCWQNSQALTSNRHIKHKTPQSASNKSNTNIYHSHSRHYSASLYKSKKLSKSAKNIVTRHAAAKHITAKPRYAYPIGTFLMEPPTFEATPLPVEISTQIKKDFYSGNAGRYPTRSLVRAGIASYYPMRGGIFWRREPVKYLIMHSTEPGIPVGAKTIVDGWSHGGRRHAGAHYVIDRDGTIYQAVDPDLATVHINIFKTLPGINNDNSVGIEMCHQGNQDYPPALVESATRLAAYLQSHYHIADANVITHRYAQKGDHTDPVNFAWENFIFQKSTLQNLGLNQRLALLKTQMFEWHPTVEEQPTVIVIDKKSSATRKKPANSENPKIIEVQAKPLVKTGNLQIIQPPSESINKQESKIQSAFEAKFGLMDKQDSIGNQHQTQIILSAPLPSSGSNTNFNTNASVPANTINNRLLPNSPVNRLVPVTMIINTQPNNYNKPSNIDIAPLPNKQNNFQDSSLTGQQNVQNDLQKKSAKILPLRGPIEMEPDQASLLSQ